MGDTIYALSSGSRPAAISVLRLSGTRCPDVPDRLGFVLPHPRRATLVHIRHPSTGEILDRALALFFPEHRSATGEAVLELHLHGGRALVRVVEDALALIGLRHADPGEFTRRAVANGRMDLFEAEALGDLLAADTEMARQLASGRGGHLGRAVADWTDRLLRVSAPVEAAIDNDLDVDEERLSGAVTALRQDIQQALARPDAERLRDGFAVVLAGPPNVGKSTLFNALVGRDAAIVSAVPGTTRDAIEATIDLRGLPVRLIDTAGQNADTSDPLELEGMRRARSLVADADLVVWLGGPPGPSHALLVRPKADTGEFGPGAIAVSALTGFGLDHLVDRIVQTLAARLPPPSQPLLNRRQRRVLEHVVASLTAAEQVRDIILVAEELGAARRLFDQLTGRSGTEDLLDRVFAGFCLGK